MREKILVDLLLNCKEPISLADIAKNLSYSESTIRKLIKDTIITSEKNGFIIELRKGKGYTLSVQDEKQFTQYQDELSSEIDVLNSDQRLEAILFHILQADGYITLEELAERILVSRSTITKDLVFAKKKLAEYQLELIKRPHYGLKIKGKELNTRKAFSRYVLHSTIYLEPTAQYKNFLKNCETGKLSEFLRNLIDRKQISVSEVIFENLCTHLKIILFRAMQNNYIKEEQIKIKQVDEIFEETAFELADWIEREFGLKLPKAEVDFLAAHLSAKSKTKEIKVRSQDRLFKDLKEILNALDEEFLTNFSNDPELILGLSLHIYPLLERLYYNLQLENPLVDEMKLKYTNVLVVSFRFGELIEEKYGYTLTRDEIGYIALHLAAHFEGEKQNLLDKVKRIVVICSTGGGSAHLIRLKLEKLFSSALIMTVSNKNIAAFKEDLPDLFLSTIPMEKEFQGVPIIQIKNFLDDMEIKHIKDLTTQQISARKMNSRVVGLRDLFSKEYLNIQKNGQYLDMIREQSDKMVQNKIASKDFTELVMEREQRFSTIYDKGVAGPHPISLGAGHNVVGVTILKEPIKWQQREVRIIFLINLKKGHLFLHKEISRFLAVLMDDEKWIARITQIQSFGEFITIIDEMITEDQ
ncbi:PRD domain-containing protein [Marinilactibacillus sp. XAAS-LB27]|uniref:BglG family transcription antiterminator n=1 Tax=Marinilactibacillus sp. XAAS-LB27 TaxID=3114538 RepID=UPI002E1976BA|nr:PRD domain-containing protein [Marinilactibacillus sp. XAAS-LB27]